MMLSTSVSTVSSWKSVRVCSLINPNMTSFEDLTNRSHAPPMWGAWGGLNDQSIRNVVAKSVIFLLSRLLTNSFSSDVAPLKLEPLSEKTWVGAPLLLINLRVASMKASVSQFEMISRWTARTVRHVNSTIHRFNCFLPCFTLT